MKSPKTSNPTFVSSLPPSEPCRSRWRPTWCRYSRTRISAPYMPNGSPFVSVYLSLINSAKRLSRIKRHPARSTSTRRAVVARLPAKWRKRWVRVARVLQLSRMNKSNKLIVQSESHVTIMLRSGQQVGCQSNARHNQIIPSNPWRFRCFRCSFSPGTCVPDVIRALISTRQTCLALDEVNLT